MSVTGAGARIPGDDQYDHPHLETKPELGKEGNVGEELCLAKMLIFVPSAAHRDGSFEP
jgi:hypothetical protein